MNCHHFLNGLLTGIGLLSLLLLINIGVPYLQDKPYEIVAAAALGTCIGGLGTVAIWGIVVIAEKLLRRKQRL